MACEIEKMAGNYWSPAVIFSTDLTQIIYSSN